MKRILLSIIFTLYSTFAFAADSYTVPELPALGAAPAGSDLLYLSDNGADKKVTVTELHTSPTFTTDINIGSAKIEEAELEILDGATPTTVELNHVKGVTSAIQTQINSKYTISGTPVDNQVIVATSATDAEGTTGLTYDGTSLGVTGTIGMVGDAVLNSTGGLVKIGKSAGESNSGTVSNFIGNESGKLNTGSYVNSLGDASAQSNAGNYVDIFGFKGAQNNAGNYVGGLGYEIFRYNAGIYVGGGGSEALWGNAGDDSNGYGSRALKWNEGDGNTAIGDEAFNAFNLDAGNAETWTTALSDNQITVTGHSFGAAGTYRNLSLTTSDTLPTGLATGMHQWYVVGTNTLRCRTDSFTAGTGSGTHTLTPQYIYTNSTAVGNNAEPTASNQMMLGDTNVTETVIHGSLTLDSATLSEAELEILDGATPTTVELNYSDGVTGPIQQQLDNIGGGAGTGVVFYMDDTKHTVIGNDNDNAINELFKEPQGGAADVDTVSCANNTVLSEAYLYDTALGDTTIQAGEWVFATYASVSSVIGGRVSSLLRNLYHVAVDESTVTVTGTGTSRTCTAAAGTPFESDDDNADQTLSGYVQTPKGLYQITAYTSPTVVTITTPTTYTNETGVAFNTWKYEFGANTGTIESLTTNYTLYTVITIQAAITIVATDKLAEIVFGISNNTTDINFVHNGSDYYSHFHSPLLLRHNDLAGLNAGDYVHITALEKVVMGNTSGTNTGDSPTALSTGTVDATTYGITSDGGVDDLTLVEADTTNAGLLGSDKWDEIVANTLKDANVSTTLEAGTVNATTYAITSDGGADDIVLPEADTTNAGLLGADKWDEIVANSLKATNVVTNLSEGTSTTTTVDVNSSDGTNATLVSASTSRAGLLTKAKFDEIVANTAKDATKLASLAVAALNDTTTPSVLTVAETTNTIISNYKATGADHVFTFPAAHAAGNCIGVIGDGFQVDYEPPSGDNFIFNGVAMDNDEHIQNTADTKYEDIVFYVMNDEGTLQWCAKSSYENFVEATP